MAKAANLVSIPTLVQSPFIIANIGGVTFGTFSGNYRTNATYPNYMESMSVTKVNGTVNTYTLNFHYQVATGQDPNLLDKIFSRATKDRRIILQYGDWMAPNYIYKEEQCIITNVTTRLNMSSSSLDYTLQCTSDAIGLNSTQFNFPSRNAKPSDVILQLLSNSKYGLKDVFTGMRNKNSVLAKNLIASNDKKVQMVAQNNTTILNYLNYLVGCMVDNKTPEENKLSTSKYFLTINDDYTNDLGGTYFKVSEVSADAAVYNATDTYELDINYPGDNFVTEFSLNNDQSWAILYEYAGDVKQEEYTYNIRDDGTIETLSSPSLLTSSLTNGKSAYKSQWWSYMTEFPITATLTLKGLTRPSMLMTYVKLNVWFAGGQKHISSGTYIITKQTDSITSAGYTTTLTLLRVGGDF
jgi:hypothetical protein